MPPTALTTTKRKFHKLLDSLASNASTTSLPSHHTTSTNNLTSSSTTTLQPTTSSSKRPRTTTTTATTTPRRPLSSYHPRPAGMVPSTTTTTTTTSTTPRPSSIALIQTQPHLSISGEHKHPPNFASWDRTAFLSRLQTFRFVDKWRAKPAKISEVEWARRGWSCVGVERVGCAGCGAGVVVGLLESDEKGGRGGSSDDKEGEAGKEEEEEGEEEEGEGWREEAREELVGRYEEMIRTGHGEGCLWRRRGCDDLIQRLPVVRQGEAVEGLRGRYEGLVKLGREVPEEVDVPEGVDVGRTLEVAKGLLEESAEGEVVAGLENGEVEGVNKSAFLLALFGWQVEENHISGLATCNACFRRLGLWLFKSSDSSMDRLDVVSEHREYCPWINPLSQNGASRRASLDGLAGWEMLLRAVNAKATRQPLGENANSTVGREGLEESNADAVGVEDAASFVGSVAEDREKVRDERDKERWAKLKKLKQVFQVKKRPGTSGTSGSATTVRTDVV